MADLTHLDSTSLQRFIDNDLADFLTDLENIRKDDASARALKSLVTGQTTPETLQQNQFLAIGPMSQKGTLVHGDALIESITGGATSIDDILADQQRLFKDIDRNTREVIKVLGKTQGDSLTSIDGEKMLDIFDDVDDDLAGSGGGGGSSRGSSNDDEDDE